jgi:hypothetical protein
MKYFNGYGITKDGIVYGRWGRPLSQQVNNAGYKCVHIRPDGKNGKYMLVHRLVAMLYIENKGGRPCVNHKNFDRLDNRVSNLEWCTYRENIEHAREGGRFLGCPGKKKVCCPFRVERVRLARSLGQTYEELSRAFLVSRGTIGNILHKKYSYKTS